MSWYLIKQIIGIFGLFTCLWTVTYTLLVEIPCKTNDECLSRQTVSDMEVCFSDLCITLIYLSLQALTLGRTFRWISRANWKESRLTPLPSTSFSSDFFQRNRSQLSPHLFALPSSHMDFVKDVVPRSKKSYRTKYILSGRSYRYWFQSWSVSGESGTSKPMYPSNLSSCLYYNSS